MNITFERLQELLDTAYAVCVNDNLTRVCTTMYEGGIEDDQVVDFSCGISIFKEDVVSITIQPNYSIKVITDLTHDGEFDIDILTMLCPKN